MNPIEIVRGWITRRAAEKGQFTKAQLEALDALDNQPLKDAWIEYCKHWAQARAWGHNTTPFKAFAYWHQTVLAAYGSQVQIEMTPEGCRLSNGQFYPYPKE